MSLGLKWKGLATWQIPSTSTVNNREGTNTVKNSVEGAVYLHIFHQDQFKFVSSVWVLLSNLIDFALGPNGTTNAVSFSEELVENMSAKVP